MRRFILAFFLLTLLAGCSGPKRELDARMIEMISFIDVVKDKEGFWSLYFDPRSVKKEKESKHWSTLMQRVPDSILGIMKGQLDEARTKSPKLTFQNQVATYVLDGGTELTLVKVDGQWYLAAEKNK
jgi:hypothetical protein